MVVQSHNSALRAILYLIFLGIMIGIYFLLKSLLAVSLWLIFPWLAVCFLAAWWLDRRITASAAPEVAADLRAPGAGSEPQEYDSWLHRPTVQRFEPTEHQRVSGYRSTSDSMPPVRRW